ncbi:putative dynamin family protein [Botrytis fragariae]|uniref:Putative dynamin family protein n=1 Tax=Botrytis fragariae TaxID=1964551 RepID=A0A8H6B3G0_9HELO|nr:putative dynamin family protein [Botrytis fragariae]KAF5878473.1 putative dynamin family protein [Botrytis fragariae]
MKYKPLDCQNTNMPPNSTPSISSDDDISSTSAARTHPSDTPNRSHTAPRAGGITEYITFGNVLAVLLIVPLAFTYVKVMMTGPALSPGSDIATVRTTATITSTIYTPSSTVISNRRSHGSSDDSSSNPWPNFTYAIRASSSGKFLASNSGGITLVGPQSGRNPGVRWKCTEIKGWLHFQNTASGCFLGHNFWGEIVCTASVADGWERFTTRPIPEGGHYLLMTHWERLWKVGIKGGTLAKIGEGETGGFAFIGEEEGEVVAWDFLRI